jgi:glycosyltransferase involved in cell wall biosynthesis
VTYAQPGDVSSWRDALARLLDDGVERERVAAQGPDRARLFDWSRIAEQTTRVYEKALSTL